MRTILHMDMDAFFASVEQHDHPEWRGKPVVVGAAPDRRGVVATASYEARAFGIHSAMPSREAGRRCPRAIFVPPNMRRYADVSRQVFAILERFTPLVEGLSIDEAFLDVTGVRRLFGDGPTVARRIKEAIHSETGLTATVGVATNKFLAKLASGMNKPDGLTIVPSSRADILAFLAPMPVNRIWGVGQVTQGVLEKAGFHTIGDLQRARLPEVARVVGRGSAEHLMALARGEDARAVETEVEEKSFSREHTFERDVSSAARLEPVLAELVEDVGRRLRDGHKYAGLARLKLRWQGFETITRQRAFASPCCDDVSLREAALALFRAERLVKPVRLIGFGVARLTERPGEQLSLFSPHAAPLARRERLSRAVDAIRARMGTSAIRRAADGAERLNLTVSS